MRLDASACLLTMQCGWFRYFVDVKNPDGECTGTTADAQGRCYLTANRPNKFTVHGALIGGPKTPTDAGNPNRVPYSTEGWNDWRTDWVGSEEAVDYNAHYTMALAASIELPITFWRTTCGGAISSECLLLCERWLMCRNACKPSCRGYCWPPLDTFGQLTTMNHYMHCR
jgi:Glycosyl hydrolase family 9